MQNLKVLKHKLVQRAEWAAWELKKHIDAKKVVPKSINDTALVATPIKKAVEVKKATEDKPL